MKVIIRALNRADYLAIRNNKPINQLRIPVYYGTNCYRDDVAHICEIVGHIRNEWPECSIRDMTVRKISEKESVAMAHRTVVCVMIDARLVKANFGKFTSI